jgi:hypothetical protein
MTAASTGAVIAGQKITVAPASTLSPPVIPASTRPGPAVPDATRSTSPCITQNSPATRDTRIAVSSIWPRQKMPASTARSPISTCVPRCVPASPPAVTPRTSRSAPVTTRPMPTRTAMAPSESFGPKMSRMPSVSMAAAAARGNSAATRAASRPGSGPGCVRAPDEVMAFLTPRHHRDAIFPVQGRNCSIQKGWTRGRGAAGRPPPAERGGVLSAPRAREHGRGKRGLPGAPAALDLAAVAASRAAGTGRWGALQPTTADVPRGRSARGATRE